MQKVTSKHLKIYHSSSCRIVMLYLSVGLHNFTPKPLNFKLHMKRLIFTIILTCIVLGDMNAQNRLYPMSETTSPTIKEYYHRLDTILSSENLEYLFLVKPSFHPESACFYDPADSTLVLRVADRNIWYSAFGKHSKKLDTPAKVNVKEYRCHISKEARSKCVMLFFSSIMSSSYLAKPMGTDGITYKIYYGAFTAECWSPNEKESNCYKLAKIIEAISDAIINKDSERIDNIIPVMESLRLKFEALYPEDVKKNNPWVDFLEYNTSY